MGRDHGGAFVSTAMISTDGGGSMTTLVAGADGCQPGWAVVLKDISCRKPPEALLCRDMATLLKHPKLPAMIAVDMPIGLPHRVGPGGRGPEAELRTYLGERKASLFSIPSRAAIYAEDFAAACEASLATSEPPRKISIQAYHLFPKVRELDELIRADMGLSFIIRECHPEGAFMVMNKREPLSEPKKIKSAINDAGIRQRKKLLMEVAGFSEEFLSSKPPRGVGLDDFIDACACAWVAERLAKGEAISFPENPERDAFDIPMAIWA
jgi:predicted RNase H-like nuclease